MNKYTFLISSRYKNSDKDKKKLCLKDNFLIGHDGGSNTTVIQKPHSYNFKGIKLFIGTLLSQTFLSFKLLLRDIEVLRRERRVQVVCRADVRLAAQW